MTYEVTGLEGIDFGATGVKEILQNVSFILSTTIYSCPMDREFGWVPDIDGPINLSINTNTARIVRAIAENEPRAIVEQVRFEGSPLEGNLKPIVKVKINE